MGQQDGPGPGQGSPAGQLGPRLIGQVAEVPQDALLQGVGIGAGADPVLVVIGLTHQ